MTSRNGKSKSDSTANVLMAVAGGIFGAYAAYTAYSAYTAGSHNVVSRNKRATNSSLSSAIRSEEMVEKDQGIVSGVSAYLYTHPLDGHIPDGTHQKHWALAFKFPNTETERWIIHEANKGDSGTLVAYCSNKEPGDEKDCELRYLGKCEISPYNLLQMAKRNSCSNKQYNLYLHNCQTWVKELAQKIGGAIWEAIKKEQTLSDSNPMTSVIGGLIHYSSGSLLNSSSAAGSTQSRPSNQCRIYDKDFF